MRRGFGLLEALVALAILAGTGIALMAWLQSNLNGLTRLQRAQHELELQRGALAVMQTINPMQEPEGERQLGAATLRWQARPVAAEKPGATPGGVPGPWTLRLYRVEVRISEGAETYAPLDLLTLGQRRIAIPDGIDRAVIQ